LAYRKSSCHRQEFPGRVSDAIIALGRAVLFFLSFFACALCERKSEKQKWVSTMLPQAHASVKRAIA
jgi:hypothetical protein